MNGYGAKAPRLYSIGQSKFELSAAVPPSAQLPLLADQASDTFTLNGVRVMQNELSWWAELPDVSFGSEGIEERLAALILAGRKRATVWNGLEENPTTAGKQWAVTANGKPVAIIETLSVGQLRFDEIDEAFAFEEGEGDRSLLYWRIVHEDFFRNEGHFAPDMLLWWEKFRLIEVLDQELAARVDDLVALEEEEARALLSRRATSKHA